MSNQLEIFFNTSELTGIELAKAQIRAGTQNDKVLDIFKSNPNKSLTPEEVYSHLGNQLNNAPITSIRRAITTLTNQGWLECTEEMRMGWYGMKNHCWRLK